MLPAAAPAAMPGMVAGTTADASAAALAVRPVVADAVAVGVDVSRAVAAVVARATVLSLAPLRRACAGRPRRAASRRERRLCRKTEPCQRERPGNRQRRPCSSQHLYHPLVSTGHPPLTTDTIQVARFLHGTTISFRGRPRTRRAFAPGARRQECGQIRGLAAPSAASLSIETRRCAQGVRARPHPQQTSRSAGPLPADNEKCGRTGGQQREVRSRAA